MLHGSHSSLARSCPGSSPLPHPTSSGPIHSSAGSGRRRHATQEPNPAPPTQTSSSRDTDDPGACLPWALASGSACSAAPVAPAWPCPAPQPLLLPAWPCPAPQPLLPPPGPGPLHSPCCSPLGPVLLHSPCCPRLALASSAALVARH